MALSDDLNVVYLFRVLIPHKSQFLSVVSLSAKIGLFFLVGGLIRFGRTTTRETSTSSSAPVSKLEFDLFASLRQDEKQQQQKYRNMQGQKQQSCVKA